MPGQPSGMGMASASEDAARVRRGGRLRRRMDGLLCGVLLGSTALSALFCVPLAQAQEPKVANLGGLTVGAFEVIQLAVFAGVMGAALLSAAWLIRERARIAGDNLALRARVADLNAAAARADAVLNLRDQRVVIWGAENKKPEIAGTLPPNIGAPEERAEFLAFGRWLDMRTAARLDSAVGALRGRGQPFDLVVETQAHAPLEVSGRRNASHAVVRFTSLGPARETEARLRSENQRLAGDMSNLLGLVDALDMPVWMRATDGSLSYVNRAYAKSVEAADPIAALRENREFLGTQAREAVAQAHGAKPVFAGRLATVVEGDRRLFTVTDVAGPHGSAGLAADVSGIEAIREEYERTLRSHTDTLDRLTTAVATFDPKMKLSFFNQAFARLWDLDAGFLESAPDNALLLDRLRSEGRIAEQPEWRRWKDALLSAYRAVEPEEHLWHLPDGRTLRVVANPQPKGGVTWVFENVTEKMDLESRYQTAVRVQGETLDNLAEGVAVFGPDGQGKLFNPAFATLWGLAPEAAVPGTHVSALRALCDPLVGDASPWGGLVASVTGFNEDRRDRSGQCELKNGTVLHYAVIHLPNGQLMATFVDVTDSVNVERALKDKNDALERADRLKNDFVQHVSYELRSPLTNIIGFTELLALPNTGPLQPRQREYLEHIGTSSALLLTIVNDILDLATVDAGIMQLDMAEVPVEETARAAAELVADRLQEHGIRLVLDTRDAPRAFPGDETRVRQVLYNLLSNAANYAPAASTITLACRRTAEHIVFSVHDGGPGMPPDVLDTVFRRFESHSNGGRRRGAGLGLSVVKSFVELHGGTVRIETSETRGTTVSCFFPLAAHGMPGGATRVAAE
ncbi:MAG: alkaline phosphatase [Mesorhizobium amorphae]|nr:MAG: alkaline phosphatase [Mesorhizobium amorphae]